MKKLRWYFKSGTRYDEYTVLYESEDWILVKNDSTGKYDFGLRSDFGTLFGFPISQSYLKPDEAIHTLQGRIKIDEKYVSSLGSIALDNIARWKDMIAAVEVDIASTVNGSMSREKKSYGATKKGVGMETKNLSCKLPLDLHQKMSEDIKTAGSTVSQFIEQVIREHYDTKHIEGGNDNMKTLAFQVDDDFSKRIKEYLKRYENTTGKKLSQTKFIHAAIEAALEKGEAELSEAKGVSHTETASAEDVADADSLDEGTE